MSEKCSETSEKFREAGNISFCNREYQDAMILYNKSLCYANKPEELSHVFANRSAIYLTLKMYERCLENIKLAKNCDYDNNKSKLHEREQKCQKFMKIHEQMPYDDPWSFFHLSYPAHEKIPFIVNSLDLREDDKFGRYLITISDLKAGDVIAIEEPFYKFIDKEFSYSRCTNCLKSNDYNLFPCSTCSSTMYCSNECKTEHENLIHHVECNKKPLPSVLIVCTKMILTAVSIAGSLGRLKSLLKDSETRSVFDLDLSDPDDPSNKINLLLVANSMAKSENSKIVITDKMKTTFNFPPFDTLWKTDEEREFLIECFHNQLRIHNTNQLEMGEHTLEFFSEQNYWYVKTVGSGLCPFASLFNHSCDANISRTCIDNKIAFIVNRPVVAGEQLFLSYGYSFHRILKDERQNLLKRYSFTCDCEACTKNYPAMNDLPKYDPDFVEPDFCSLTVTQAKIKFKNNCEYIDKNIKRHPSYETTKLMIHNDHLLYQIARTRFGSY